MSIKKGVGRWVAHSPWSTVRRGRDHEVCPCFPGVSPGAAHIDGAAAVRARRDKELKYQELVVGNLCALVVVAVETGGHWSREAVDFVSSLAEACARDAPPLLRLCSLSCGRAFASSLVTSCSVTLDGQDGPLA